MIVLGLWFAVSAIRLHRVRLPVYLIPVVVLPVAVDYRF
jgi:hypothetical protein